MYRIVLLAFLMMMPEIPEAYGKDGDRSTWGSPPHKSIPRSTIPHPIKSPFSFTNTHSYLVAKFRIYNTFSIKFMMKTIEPNGLIMYSGYPSNDFMGLELYAGQLRYIFDVGSGPRVIHTVKNKKRRQDSPFIPTNAIDQALVNDNAWHRIHLYRPFIGKHVLEVDGTSFVDYLPDSRSVFYDLPEDLYLGGIPDELLTSESLSTQINSRAGFRGCLASLTLDEREWKFGENVSFIPEKFKETITIECSSLPEECSESSCFNGGKCIQRWKTTECDCSMTSFVGDRCNESSLGYKFGPTGGAIIMRFDEGEDRRNDEIAFGLETEQRTTAVLVRLTSFASSDFITIEMDDGMIYVTYNMGKVSHRLDSKSIIYSTDLRWQDFKVNDKRYHVVRLVRTSQNSTLFINDNPALDKCPPGKQLTVFNQLKAIQVGGSALVIDVNGPFISKPFLGAIYGLSVNGLRVLEMASDGDQRLAIIGDAVEIKQNNHTSSSQSETSLTKQMIPEDTTQHTTSIQTTTTNIQTTTTTNIQTTTQATTIIKNGRKTNQLEICRDKNERHRNSPTTKLCRKQADDNDDDDVTSSGMTSLTDDEDMIVGMDVRPNYKTIEQFKLTSRPSSTLGEFLTRSKKVKVQTIHQWHDPAEEYIRNLNFTFANVRPQNSSHQVHRNAHNGLVRTTLNSGLLLGSVVTLIAVLLFFPTLLLLLKQKQKFSTKWKALDDSFKTSTTQDSEKFHQHQQQQSEDQTTPIQGSNHTHLLNGTLHVHPTVKVNSKEWYV